MLDRPVFTQLRKLSTSAMMYLFVIAVGMGSVLLAVRKAMSMMPRGPLLPLRWNMR